MPYDPHHTFDARTAYNGDWQFAPGVVRADRTRSGAAGSQSFYLRQITADHPAYPAALEQLGLQSTQEAWEAWKQDAESDALRPGDLLEIDERPETQKLIVGRVGAYHYSRLMFSSTRAPL